MTAGDYKSTPTFFIPFSCGRSFGSSFELSLGLDMMRGIPVRITGLGTFSEYEPKASGCYLTGKFLHPKTKEKLRFFVGGGIGIYQGLLDADTTKTSVLIRTDAEGFGIGYILNMGLEVPIRLFKEEFLLILSPHYKRISIDKLKFGDGTIAKNADGSNFSLDFSGIGGAIGLKRYF